MNMRVILLSFFGLLLLLAGDANARMFMPKGDQYIDEPAEPWYDKNNNGIADCSGPDGNGDGTPDNCEFVDYNHNGKWDNYTINPTNATYSATFDSAFTPLANGSGGITLDLSSLAVPVCMYNRLVDPPELIVNDFMLLPNQKVLFGVKNSKFCPLPGSTILSPYTGQYSIGLVGDFLISGAVCVVNSVIFDAMFRVYCTILLWFYSILYAMMIVYIMFYGIAVMIGIGRDPIREAPKRALKIILIFFLATNAQFGFQYVHKFFLTVLNKFDDYLSVAQPMYNAQGQPAYKKIMTVENFINDFLGLNMASLYQEGPLLDEKGMIWQPLPDGTQYYDPFHGTTGTIHNVPSDYRTLDPNYANQYVPFRVPNQQWTYVSTPDPSAPKDGSKTTYTIVPVFELLSTDQNKVSCIFDVAWNANAADASGNPIITNLTQGGAQVPVQGQLELRPRCQKNFWNTLPKMMPYGSSCEFTLSNGKMVAAGTCSSGASQIYPKRLEDVTYDSAGNPTVTNNICNDITGLTCRKAFQGILGRIDALFNSVVGDDNAKSVGALASALLLWGIGGGALLSAFLMTGLLTMMIAFVQTLWVFVTALMCLVFLLMLSPIFISCLLFKTTERFFQGWIAAMVSYCMQPFLIMSFIYALSSITSMSVLDQLVRNETGMKLFHVGNSPTSGYFWSRSFKEPLYEMPKDFRERFDPDTLPTYDPSGNRTILYINGEQREAYLASKSRYILSQYILTQTGVQMSNTFDKNEVDKIDDSNNPGAVTAKEAFNLWVSGTPPSNGTPTDKRGIYAIMDYQKVTGDTRFNQLITDYQNGLNPETANGQPKSDPDDDDAYLGERGDETTGPPLNDGESWALDGSTHYREFPVCVKNCPQFEPPYNPIDTIWANPDLTQPLNQVKVDGTPCDPNNPDAYCQTVCTRNCMFVPGGLINNYRHILTAILMWVLLNTVTAAFMSKVPAIAASLSNWQSYAPSLGAMNPIILGGRSAGLPGIKGMGQASTYNVGGTMGQILRFGDKAYKTLSEPYYKLDMETGILVPVDKKSIVNYGFKSNPYADQEKFGKEFNSLFSSSDTPSRQNVYQGTLTDLFHQAGIQTPDRATLWDLVKKGFQNNKISYNSRKEDIVREIQRQLNEQIQIQQANQTKNR